MPFKVRDLMITNLSDEDTDGGPIAARTCRPATAAVFCFVSNLTSENWTILTPVVGTVFGSTAPGSPAESAVALAALKEQLKKQIAEIEKREQVTDESLLPQTVEQVDALSAKLTEALETLKQHRVELARKLKAGGGD